MRGVFTLFALGLALAASAEGPASFEMLVGLANRTGPTRMPLGVEVVERIDALGVWRVRVDDERVLARLRVDPNVRYVEPNLAAGFRISGLGQLVESAIQSDRLVVFGD